jgi:hypothetical protein
MSVPLYSMAHATRFPGSCGLYLTHQPSFPFYSLSEIFASHERKPSKVCSSCWPAERVDRQIGRPFTTCRAGATPGLWAEWRMSAVLLVDVQIWHQIFSPLRAGRVKELLPNPSPVPPAATCLHNLGDGTPVRGLLALLAVCRRQHPKSRQ